MAERNPKGYGHWDAPTREPNTDETELAKWRGLTQAAALLAKENDWSKTQFAKAAGEAPATFSEWYNGRDHVNYKVVNLRVDAFLKDPKPRGEPETLRRISGNADRYEPWAPPKSEPAKLDGAELARWKRLAGECRAAAEQFKFSKAEVSRRSGVPSGTFSQWYDGTYAGVVKNVSDKMESWLRALKEMVEAAALVPDAPGYIDTPTSREMTDTLLYAQLMAEMVVITLGAGMGKTMTMNEYRRTHPNSHIATMRPSTAGVYNMMRELAQALDVHERNPAKLDSAIGAVLKRNGRQTLLMIDEAQVLSDDAINQLRHFLDVYGTGIALIGNEELYGRFGGQKAVPSYAQIHRRIGKRLRRMQPLDGDVESLIDAWGVKDKPIRDLLRAIGRKPGALSQITKTVQLAGMYAAGEGRPVEARDISAAWTNRSGGDL